MKRRDPVKLVLGAWTTGVLVFLFAPLFVVALFSFNDSPISRFPLSGFTLEWYASLLRDRGKRHVPERPPGIRNGPGRGCRDPSRPARSGGGSELASRARPGPRSGSPLRPRQKRFVLTLTIVAREAESGLLGIAQATNPLSVGARCPFFRPGVGAVSTQAYTDPGLGPRALELLAGGSDPEAVLAKLSLEDSGVRYRQIGIVDARGRVAVRTGDLAPDHKGDRIGDGFVVMGNLLANESVLPAMERAWLGHPDALFEERLMVALTEGRDAGGDSGSHRSACLIVYGDAPYGRTDLRIDFAPKRAGQADAVDRLRRLLARYIPLIPYYQVRPNHPSMPGWQDWLREQEIVFQD